MKLYDTIRQYEKDINKADVETRKIDDINAKREAEIDCIIDSLKDIYGDEYNKNLAREVINQRYNYKRGAIAFHKYCFVIDKDDWQSFLGIFVYVILGLSVLLTLVFSIELIYTSGVAKNRLEGFIVSMTLNIIWYLVMIGKKWQCSDKDWYQWSK